MQQRSGRKWGHDPGKKRYVNSYLIKRIPEKYLLAKPGKRRSLNLGMSLDPGFRRGGGRNSADASTTTVIPATAVMTASFIARSQLNPLAVLALAYFFCSGTAPVLPPDLPLAAPELVSASACLSESEAGFFTLPSMTSIADVVLP